MPGKHIVMKRLILLSVLLLSFTATSSSQTQPVVENYEWTPGSEAPLFSKMNLPFYSLYIEPFRCKLVRQIRIDNGNSYLVYASFGNETDNNVVNFVYLIPAGYKNKRSELHPPVVKVLRYHNLGGGGEDPDYCSVFVESYRFRDEDHRRAVTTHMDRKINEDGANMLIDLISGDGKFVYKSGGSQSLEFEETTSPRLADPF